MKYPIRSYATESISTKSYLITYMASSSWVPTDTMSENRQIIWINEESLVLNAQMSQILSIEMRKCVHWPSGQSVKILFKNRKLFCRCKQYIDWLSTNWNTYTVTLSYFGLFSKKWQCLGIIWTVTIDISWWISLGAR